MSKVETTRSLHRGLYHKNVRSEVVIPFDDDLLNKNGELTQRSILRRVRQDADKKAMKIH